MATKIGTAINVRLAEKNWSQRKLASESGLSITCINKIITGANKKPSTSTLIKLSKTLGMAPNDLFDLLNF